MTISPRHSKSMSEYKIKRVSLPKAVDKILNGWELSATADWQTGSPFTIFSGGDYSQSGMLADRADLHQGTPFRKPSWAEAVPTPLRLRNGLIPMHFRRTQ